MQLSKKEIVKKLTALLPLNSCLCCGFGPKLHVSSSSEPYTFHCVGCGFFCGPYAEIQPAATDWHRSNRQSDAHIAYIWSMRYERQGPYFLFNEKTEDAA